MTYSFIIFKVNYSEGFCMQIYDIFQLQKVQRNYLDFYYSECTGHFLDIVFKVSA